VAIAKLVLDNLKTSWQRPESNGNEQQRKWKRLSVELESDAQSGVMVLSRMEERGRGKVEVQDPGVVVYCDAIK
jgi:hypothetical protein